MDDATILRIDIVATVLTVYGIETLVSKRGTCPKLQLQQSLPFTVLKRYLNITSNP